MSETVAKTERKLDFGVSTKDPRESQFFFEIVKGSNYAITDSFNKTEVIDFAQFTKFANVLFGDIDFITINNIIIAKRYIYRIEPTNALTSKQVKAKAEEEKRKREEDRKKEEYIAKLGKYEVQWMDEHYPQGWYLTDMIKERPNIKIDFDKHESEEGV